MLKLQFLDNRQPAMWLVDERITIGRDKSNKLVINDEGVSIHHAELRQEDGKLYLCDSGSVNGTFVNGEKLAGKREVQAGDVLRFYMIEALLVDPAKGPAVIPQTVNRDVEKAALPQWQVKAMTGTISGKMFLIDGTKIIGRDPGCDIVVAGAHVSRRHAELSIRSGKLWVKDLGSSNGSFVNGQRHEETQLKNGDEVKFDAVIFKVVGPSDVGESFDEADMTQFRPAVAARPAPAPAVSPQPTPTPTAVPAPVAVSVAEAVAPKPVPPASVPSSKPAAPAQTAAPKATPLGPIVLIALAVLIVIALIFIMK